MFTKLPELFDRNFAIGYFLPVASFTSATIALLSYFSLLPAIFTVNTVNQIDILLGTTLIGLFSWLAGIILLATNRDLIRILEGYGNFNPLNLVMWVERRNYKSLEKSIMKLNGEYINVLNDNNEFPTALRLERNRLMRLRASRFPDREEYLLPTSFGNTIRAFESYSRIMYGIDAIPGWERLLTVIPETYIKLINDAKTLVDFWVNIFSLSFLFGVEYMLFILTIKQFPPLWIIIVTIVTMVIAYQQAVGLAVEWGGLVKSAFDVYLPELREKLALNTYSDLSTERLVWLKLSQSFIYHDPESMPERQLHDKDETTPKNTKVEIS